MQHHAPYPTTKQTVMCPPPPQRNMEGYRELTFYGDLVKGKKVNQGKPLGEFLYIASLERIR